MPITILCVEKSGSIKEIELKTYNESELYKKAGFKTIQGFELQTEWGAEINGKTYSVSVFGKTIGRAGQENKYDFPPPIDNTLFFGACLLINKENNLPTSLLKTEWKAIYEHLFGGFEDIGTEDSDEEEEEDSDDDGLERTKEGYVKDDFIVDDEDSQGEETTSSSEEEIIIKKKAVKKDAKKAVKKDEKINSSKKKTEKPVKNVFTKINESEGEKVYLDCTSELSEEEYV